MSSKATVNSGKKARSSSSSSSSSGNGSKSNEKRRVVDGAVVAAVGAAGGSSSRSGSSTRSPFFLSPELLKILAQSNNFLTTAELGRLLLMTSKRLTAKTFATPEGVWKAICYSKWGLGTAPALIEGLGGSAEQCFRKFVKQADIYRFQGLRPLRYTPADYPIVINISDRSQGDKTLISKAIRGEEVPGFFESSELSVELERPFRLWTGNAVEPIHDGGDAAAYMKLYNTYCEALTHLTKSLDNLKADVHIVRLPDQRCIPLMEKWGAEIMRGEGGLDTFFTHSEVSLDLRSPCHLMRRYGMGDSLEFDIDIEYDVTTTAFAISGFKLAATFESSDHGFVSEVSEQIAGQPIVTFAHFLEELSFWSVADSAEQAQE